MIFMSMRKEKYYDYEMTGCSTCSAGDAGVFDYEEMYQMPDDYYSDAENDEIYEEDEIYEDDTFAGDDDNVDAEDMYADGYDDAEDEDMYADGYDDAEDEAIAVTEDIMATEFDEEEGMGADMVFAEEVMDGVDGEEDVDMLEIDELDAEEDNYTELI
jgi:hypothetical protein